jgi:hypothetical protein
MPLNDRNPGAGQSAGVFFLLERRRLSQPAALRSVAGNKNQKRTTSMAKGKQQSTDSGLNFEAQL